ncbi:hypothetical protein B0T26DRAFT_756125 [Lasiosphaeria miniovina]|uniref:Reverse transcriptase n=1 Tax=Lasiosphaeria miniovina TaxID=1954250 RepID=A0AA39ZZT1_9PEZI|nr:uncharacterized protein B0T26DRAFT_756125 [Lasiosphaeria miniovina]KAK0706647.1 hypothetical protein B0T26DRAFT_756125 [Lasiosphaeria miniovina]
MASLSSVLSKTLQSITRTKIRELDSRRNSYETRKREWLDKVDAAADQRDRLSVLVDAIKDLCPFRISTSLVSNIERWLTQSPYDASMPMSKLASVDSLLRNSLDIESRRLDIAHLYSRLLTEWMDQANFDSLPPLANRDSDRDDSFELVERQRQPLAQLVDNFESVAFEPLETSGTEMRAYLDGLFPDEESQEALGKMRKYVQRYSSELIANLTPFKDTPLRYYITGLLTEDIMGDEKRAILNCILENDVTMAEIADVLNLRFSDLKRWHWDQGKTESALSLAQASSMIFVQYIGIELCMILKRALVDFMYAVCARNIDGHQALSQRDLDRRQYYLNNFSPSPDCLEADRRETYLNAFFLSQLPSNVASLSSGAQLYDDDDNGNSNNPSSIKQKLLRQLAAELDPSTLWCPYATGLPHTTMYSTMRYVGLGEDWIDLNKKYLEAPLNLDAASDDRPQLEPRPPRRGVLIAHASEKLAGELVLSFMDLAVNRRTGILLYRLHDDIWFVGEPERSVQAWTCMQDFAQIVGLEFNRSKTGSVYLPWNSEKDTKIAQTLPKGQVAIGFLCIDPVSGKWVIDQNKVMAHVDQLGTQLRDSKSVLSWVQTWNSCIGRFFSHTFWELPHCFGREHIDNVLDTYSKMLQRLFPNTGASGGSMVEHPKGVIQDRFGVANLPHPFIFLPERLGGLGLRSPFINLFLVRNNTEDPEDIIEELLKDEREDYLAHKKIFDALKFSRFRERRNRSFRNTFEKLITVPNMGPIHLSREVSSELGIF